MINKQDASEIIPDNSIDFFYSFIVFQHFDSINEIEYYLDLIKRKITKNGVGIIYMADNRKNNQKYYIVRDEDFNSRACSLFLKPAFAKRLFKKIFKIIEIKNKLPKRLWNYDLLSGQFYIKFKNK